MAMTPLVAKPLVPSRLLLSHLRRLRTHSIMSLPPPPVALPPPAVATAEEEEALSSTLSLDNTSRLFSRVPTRSVLFSLANLHLMSLDPAVDAAIAVMRSRVMETDNLLRRAMLRAIKRTAYAHFCAGENLAEAARTMEGLWQQGLRGILDYGLEDVDGNEACDDNLRTFLATVDMTTTLPDSSVSFACVKITAICPISILERASDLLRWEHRHPSSVKLPWKLPSFPILCDDSPFYHTPSAPAPLSPSEERDLHLAQARLSALCQRCADYGLPILVDAEYTSVQPAIDHMTYSAMIQFNKKNDEGPVVYGTMQAYLRDSMERLALATCAAEKQEVPVGFKLVRGAYMSREKTLASSLGATSPIHPTIGATHSCYNRCASFLLDKIAQRSGSLLLATHNMESGRLVAAKARELGIKKADNNLQFAQLKGMAEGLSFALRNAGFNVSKYLAFGPVGKVIPYLLRRAEENRSVLSASTMDRHLMWGELKRRFKSAAMGTYL